MRVRNRNGKSISGIGGKLACAWQKHPNHCADLGLAGMTVTGDGLFDAIGGIFADGKATLRAGDDGGTAGLAEFKGRQSILINESFFDRRFVRAVLSDDTRKTIRQRAEPFGHREISSGANAAGRHERKPVSFLRYDPPAGMTQAGIEAKDEANRGHQGD
jgi:hypothetical protein